MHAVSVSDMYNVVVLYRVLHFEVFCKVKKQISLH